jgi:hypothetical protein
MLRSKQRLRIIRVSGSRCGTGRWSYGSTSEEVQRSGRMDAREFFQDVVSRTYSEFAGCSNDIALLWNALVSMNSVAEYLALEKLNYAQVSRDELTSVANQIRQQHFLLDLQFCADTFKHVRKIKDHSGGKFTLTSSSTGVSSDKTTWVIERSNEVLNVVDVLEKSFAKLNEIPQLK